MMKLSTAAEVLGAAQAGGDVWFDSVSTDSRSLNANALFVALRGEHFDGHRFTAAAGAAGAVAALVESGAGRDSQEAGLPLLYVPDTRRALGELGRYWRSCFDLPVVAVSGSNGKTTVKEMIGAILRAHYGPDQVLVTAGNLNNDIGVPLTLLRLRAGHWAAVVELGMNHPGETARLAAMARPTIGLINNAQREHQEFMRSVEEVAREHGTLLTALPPGGIAVVNADDAFARYWLDVAGGRRVMTFSLERTAEVRGRYQGRDLGAELLIEAGRTEIAVTLGVAGVHNVRNALAATAVALAAGASPGAIKTGLEGFRAVRGRLDCRPGRSGALVIDDTYNANPDSVAAAIDVLAALPGPRVLVLGDMGEVGDQGEAFHGAVGHQARAAGIDRLLCLGTLSRATVQAFGAGAEHLTTHEAALVRLEEMMPMRPTILVKGSRFMRMERIVAPLLTADSGS